MGAPLLPVKVKQLEGVALYRRRELFFRFDVWPFATIYASVVLAAATGCPLWTALAVFGVGVLFHVFLLLLSYWLVEVKCLLTLTPCTGSPEAQMHAAEVVKVVPVKMGNGVKMLCPFKPPGEQLDDVCFEHYKQRYKWHQGQQAFVKLVSRTKESFGQYARYTGYGTEALLVAARKKWGSNVFQIPLPSFWELFQVQLLQPFFCFQVLCVALWCLDEYWYYSLFTLAMLMLFESTVTQARLRMLADLRTLATPMQPVLAHRGGKWARVEGSELVPGDIISIGRPSNMVGVGEDLAVPADCLLLAGSCIVNEAVLTGESTPQWKVAIDSRDAAEKFDPKTDQRHIIAGGTKIIQHTQEKLARLRTPDGGCLALVQRTGFSTSQGKLMRTIMFSTEQASANNTETSWFIAFFLVFAVAAAGYVLMHGLANPDRSRYKLLLHCVMIVTSVIPPELPMELSIAVNTSLMALQRLNIFCTEPFRIPFAGKIDICCFDKTGTLTSDEMMFEGVVEPAALPAAAAPGGKVEVSSAVDVDYKAHCVLAACHGLVVIDEKLVGDPVEVAGLKGTGWNYSGQDVVSSRNKHPMKLRIMKRHHFLSELRRMSVVMCMEEGYEAGAHFALVKGAPETLASLFTTVPDGYQEAYKRCATQGARVLALGIRKLNGDVTLDEIRALTRSDVERDLTFAGFAVFSCPVKRESKPTVEALQAANHGAVMITGDACLTACHVASTVGIQQRCTLILSPSDSAIGRQWYWTSPDEAVRTPYSMKPLPELAQEYDLCVDGEGLLQLQRDGVLEDVVRHVQVFARVNPEQKELIIRTMRSLGLVALMCGDGTNDVGALKSADVGIALLQATGAKAKKRGGRDKMKSLAGRRKDKEAGKARTAHEAWQEPDANTVPIVRLGDASMASAFTAKTTSIHPCVDLVRQGRCTLITTLQTYKILGLNSLCSAYILSVQYLDGVKFGDTQATALGIITAMLFLFLSHAKPMPSLCAQRPYSSIFTPYFLLSVLGQSTVHFAFLILSVRGAVAFMPPDAPKMDPDGDFAPNIVNSVSFVANLHIMTTNFSVNYTGAPFSTPLHQNRLLLGVLLACFTCVLCILVGLGEMFEDMLEILPMPDGFRYKLLGLAVLDTTLAFAIEAAAKWLFPSRPPQLVASKRALTGVALQTKKLL